MAILESLSRSFSPPDSAPELELKFALPAVLAPVMLPWLQAHCQPHPEFPTAHISSVYYDTGDWRLLNAKVASDYFKRKVRLRWYRPLGDGPVAGPAFIEAKLKEGARRDKARVLLPEGAASWAARALESAEYPAALSHLQARGIREIERLRPAFQIGYVRHRFVHPFTRATLCLDSEIRVDRTHRLVFRQPRWAPLATAVLEQKGPRDRLDPIFGDLSRFGARKASFSKYLRCYAHLTGAVL